MGREGSAERRSVARGEDETYKRLPNAKASGIAAKSSGQERKRILGS